MSNQQPILITGPHRSGSTWLGKMIAASSEVGYVHEPLNPSHRPGVCGAVTERYFLNVYDDSPEKWKDALRKTIAFRYDFQAEVSCVRSLKDLFRMMRDAGRFGWHRLNGHRALLKDPIALFSAEWIAETFNPKIIVVMRHPAAFVSSLKRLGWEFPFQHLAAQPRLLEEQLTPFAEKIRKYATKSYDIIDQGALLWNIFAYTISSYREKHDDWVFVRHEDVAAHPVSEFQSMYRYCDLSFTESVERVIRDHSSATNPADPTDTSTDHHLHRDSKSVTQVWRDRLTAEEIQRIRNRTAEYLSNFYSPATWGEQSYESTDDSG